MEATKQIKHGMLVIADGDTIRRIYLGPINVESKIMGIEEIAGPPVAPPTPPPAAAPPRRSSIHSTILAVAIAVAMWHYLSWPGLIMYALLATVGGSVWSKAVQNAHSRA